VDQRPDEERPVCGSNISFLGGSIDVSGAGDGINVATEEEEVNEHVHDLEKNAVLPAGRSGLFSMRVMMRHGLQRAL